MAKYFYAMILIPITFAVGAIIMAYNGINGWGWFIFAAVLTVPGVEKKDKNDDD